MTGAPSVWRFYAPYLRGSYRTLLSSLPLSIGQMLTILPITAVVRRAFDTIIPAGDAPGLVLAGASILLLYLANVALTLWSRHLVLTATKRAVSDLRNDLLRTCYDLSWPAFREGDTGRLHSAIVQDTERVDVMTVALVAVLLPSLLIGIALCAVLLFIDLTLFAVLIAVVPVLVMLSRYLAWQAKDQARAFHRSFETFSVGVAFVLRAMELTRTQGAEQTELERQGKNVEAARVISGRVAWLFTANSSVQSTVLAGAGVLVLIVGGQSVAAGTLSLGQLLSFSVATALLVTYLSAALGAVPQLVVGREALRSLTRLWQTIDTQPYSGRQRRLFLGRVKAEAVWFQYGDRPLLRGIDLTLSPQTTTALIGPNGAGKSTLLQLILGFYRPHQGQLYADDQPYSDLDLVHLRRCIGVVPQDPLIFPGTVLENILYGSPAVGQADVVRAAEAALAHEFIGQLPRGYDTIVGEGGVLLSGGQRQRLAIARALVRNPVLLILDEPGNHLDRPSVRRLMESVRRGDRPPATLIITHDEEIISACDVVCRLEEGLIVTRVGLLTAGAAAGPGVD